MYDDYCIKRRSLHGHGDGGNGNTDDVVAVVKKIDKAPKSNERKVQVKIEGERGESAFYVERKHAYNLKPEHKYKFHLEEDVFRGGSSGRFSETKMIRRSAAEPTKVSESGFSGSF